MCISGRGENLFSGLWKVFNCWTQPHKSGAFYQLACRAFKQDSRIHCSLVFDGFDAVFTIGLTHCFLLNQYWRYEVVLLRVSGRSDVWCGEGGEPPDTNSSHGAARILLCSTFKPLRWQKSADGFCIIGGWWIGIDGRIILKWFFEN
jgi:hypothetical protein